MVQLACDVPTGRPISNALLRDQIQARFGRRTVCPLLLKPSNERLFSAWRSLRLCERVLFRITNPEDLSQRRKERQAETKDNPIFCERPVAVVAPVLTFRNQAILNRGKGVFQAVIASLLVALGTLLLPAQELGGVTWTIEIGKFAQYRTH